MISSLEINNRKFTPVIKPNFLSTKAQRNIIRRQSIDSFSRSNFFFVSYLAAKEMSTLWQAIRKLLDKRQNIVFSTDILLQQRICFSDLFLWNEQKINVS